MKKRKFKDKLQKFLKNSRKKKLLYIVLFLGIVLIVTTYAWFSISLDVKIKFFDMKVSSNSGLFISLDGVDFYESIEISMDSVIEDLRKTYPNHTNQWARGGLWPVSTIGIKNSNQDKFEIYGGSIVRYRTKERELLKYLNTYVMDEYTRNAYNRFISFDVFLKNVSGSPYNDNLYIDQGTYIDFEDAKDENDELMNGIMNSMRIGILKIGSTPSNSEVSVIQSLKCEDNCEFIIYEPNCTSHTEASVKRVKTQHLVDLVDGEYKNTYAIINVGEKLEYANGHIESGIALDERHFQLQKTMTEDDFEYPIFQIPNGITKVRLYVWIEGQDMDSLETNSSGAPIFMSVDLIKDLEGYR